MTDSGYGLWPLVALDTVLFAVFAASFFHPRTAFVPAALRHPLRAVTRTGRSRVTEEA